MNSAKRRFSMLCMIVFVIVCLIVPVSAITFCFDYAMYRVDGEDHNGMSCQTLNDELTYHNYAPAVTFDSSTPDGVQSAVDSLRPKDIVFIGCDHVGYVNDDLSIDHYLQSPDSKLQGKPVDVQRLISDPYYQLPVVAPNGQIVKRLNLNDNLPSMIAAHTQKGLSIYVRHAPGYTPSTSVIMTATTLDLSGTWYMGGPYNVGMPCKISQTGSTLTFTNEKGNTVTGDFIDSKTVEAIGWSGLRGTLSDDGTRISWANGTWWTRYSSDISGYTRCPSGQTNCNGNCIDTSSDSQNCGSCGNACAQGESCVSGSCSPSGGTTPSTTQDKYAVFLLTNIAGGSIWVGSEQEIQTKTVCSFPGGGLCKNDGTDALVQYVKESQDFSSYDDAQAAYCAAPKSNVRQLPLTGGTKAEIYGGDYWIDTAPSCPSG